jgi:tetrahydromethanopterin S-methyltransferase subunit F
MKPAPRPKDKVIRKRKKPVIEIDKNYIHKTQDEAFSAGLLVGGISGVIIGLVLYALCTFLLKMV